MIGDNILKDDDSKDGLETAIIESYVKHADLGADFEPMTGLEVSLGTLSVCDGTLSEDLDTKTEIFPLGLAQGKGMVIGRQEGGGTEYLDPRFRPTQRLPGNCQGVVVNAFRGIDSTVSRGHFTLIGSPVGIIFVNGVPRRGGGIRPPLNGTLLIEPEQRGMAQGERILVEPGKSIKIRLPNHMEVLISAA
jgi:hypothetical protein